MAVAGPGVGVGIDGGEDELRGGGVVVVGSHGYLGASAGAALFGSVERGGRAVPAAVFGSRGPWAMSGIVERTGHRHSVVRGALVIRSGYTSE